MELQQLMQIVKKERKPLSIKEEIIQLNDNKLANFQFLTILDRLCMKNSKGKNGFRISEDLNNVLVDVIKHANNEKGRLNLNKGICLIGNCGSGKTNLIEAYRIFRKHYKQNLVISRCVDLVNEFNSIDKHTNQMKGAHGIKVWTNKTDKVDRAFDDLGNEETLVQYYGNKTCVMANILDARHVTRLNARTFITTNLSLSDIRNEYGERIESRLNELCNIVYLGSNQNSTDFRKL